MERHVVASQSMSPGRPAHRRSRGRVLRADADCRENDDPAEGMIRSVVVLRILNARPFRFVTVSSRALDVSATAILETAVSVYGTLGGLTQIRRGLAATY